jgi:hypothetical protein
LSNDVNHESSRSIHLRPSGQPRIPRRPATFNSNRPRHPSPVRKLSSSTCYKSDIINRVKACSVNPIDCKIRAGTYDDAPGRFTISRSQHHLPTNSKQRLLRLRAQRLPYPRLRWRRNCPRSWPRLHFSQTRRRCLLRRRHDSPGKLCRVSAC